MNIHPVLEVESLYFSFGKNSKTYLLENISFKLYPYQITSLIGPNGVGKSTLFKIILGFYKPTKGKIKFYTKDIGYIPQHLSLENLYPATVKEILLSVAINKKIFNKVIKDLHIENILERKFTSLSGGQKQVVLIALNLVKKAKVLLLDEPTSALDPHYQRHFIEILKNLKMKGLSIFMILHDIYLAKSISDRIIALNKRIVFDGPPQKLDDYLEKIYSYSCKLLASANK